MNTLSEIDAQIDAHFAACDQQHPEDCTTCADLFTARADAHGEPATYTEAGGDQTPVTFRGWADAAGRILDDRLPAEERRQSATYALIQRTPEAQAQLVEAARITA